MLSAAVEPDTGARPKAEHFQRVPIQNFMHKSGDDPVAVNLTERGV
jgi:hypothetical protein